MVHNLFATGPAVVIAGAALLVLVIEAVSDKVTDLEWLVALAAFVGAGVWGWVSAWAPTPVFGGMLLPGGQAGYWTVLFCTAGFLSTLLSREYIARQEINHGEYYALLLFAVTGMVFMAAAGDLIVFFLGLELMSVAFYVLAGFARTRPTSNESGLKYFLLGAFATGFLLYGIALIYGATGSTEVGAITSRIPSSGVGPLLAIGFSLVLVGLAFKVAAVPFHMWVPDVYEGAPTTVSAFMSTGGKAAAFAVIVLLFSPAVTASLGNVRTAIAVIAALSMVVGNIMAIAQSSVKRMLAYSSIAHAGYVLCGVAGASAIGKTGVLFYLLAYTLMNVGAFGVVALLESKEGRFLKFDEYAGLGSRKPLLAGVMGVFLFSLAGVPPFAGFFAKYLVFAGAIEGGYTWLAILGVIMSVVSAYFYLRLMVIMFFKDGEPGDVRIPWPGAVALGIAVAGLVGLGILPSLVLGLLGTF